MVRTMGTQKAVGRLDTFVFAEIVRCSHTIFDKCKVQKLCKRMWFKTEVIMDDNRQVLFMQVGLSCAV